MGSSVVVLSDSVPTGIREFREKSSIRIGQSLCD
jgi:hypothetical protein